MPLYIPKLRGLTVEKEPEQRREVVSTPISYRWHGAVVAREWPADMDEEELALMRAGGSRWRLALAREFGEPVQLDEVLGKEARRLMDRNCLVAIEFNNVACNLGRTNILNFLSYATVAANPGYTGVVAFAVGTTAGAPSSTDTALYNEVFRKGITLTTISGNQINFTTNFAANEGNYAYQDCGLFGSTSGSIASTSSVNTGILYAHASYVYTKTSSITLTNDYYVTLT